MKKDAAKKMDKLAEQAVKTDEVKGGFRVAFSGPAPSQDSVELTQNREVQSPSTPSRQGSTLASTGSQEVADESKGLYTGRR